MPEKPLTRREFLMLALAGTGSIAWLLTHPKLKPPSPTPSSSPTATSTSTAVQVAASPTEAPIIIPAKSLTKNQARAAQTYQAVEQYFSIPGSPLFIEAINPTDDKYCAYLWPYTGVLSAVAALTSMPDNGSLYHSELERVIKGLDAYYDPGSKPPAYQSFILEKGGGERFYDDNEWVGLIYLNAYRILKQPDYLKKAIEVFNYSISGWTGEVEGGIYWREYGNMPNQHKTKNTCSTAPAAILGLQLYQETGDNQYLQWAEKIVKWMGRLKDPDTGVYWDNIDVDGFIDKRSFTYNTGTMIQANSLLSSITGEKDYLAEARALSSAGFNYFPRDFIGSGVLLYHDDPWFNAVLLRGYIALYDIDPAKDRRYIDHMRQNLDYAWKNARTPHGLFAHNWQGPVIETTRKWILDSAAMVELYALVSHYD